MIFSNLLNLFSNTFHLLRVQYLWCDCFLCFSAAGEKITIQWIALSIVQPTPGRQIFRHIFFQSLCLAWNKSFKAFTNYFCLFIQLVILPSVRNITYPKADNTTLLRYEQAFSLSTWSNNQEEIQASLAPYFSSVFEGGKACSCNDTGSNSSSCEENGGQCSCKPNVDGLSCDRCKPGFYDFTETGCKG